MTRTYDEKQIEAVLTVCAHCGRAYYMTLRQPVCLLCRRVLDSQ